MREGGGKDTVKEHKVAFPRTRLLGFRPHDHV